MALRDLDYANRLTKRYSGKLLYCPQNREWYEEHDGTWKESSDDAAAVRAAVEVMKRSESVTACRVESVLRLARRHERMVIHPSALDYDRHILNTPNGAYDLRSNTLLGKRPDLFLTRQTAVCPIPDPEALNEWLELVAWSIGDHLLLWFQKLCGYFLTGEIREQEVYISLGNGANGKSVIWGVMRRVMGTYARIAPRHVVTARDGEAREDSLAACRGYRALFHSEPEPGHHLCEALLKDFTGEGMISARKLYGQSFDYPPQAKIIIVANHKPRIRGTDDGIWRRMRVLLHPNTKPPSEQIRDLADQLFERCGPAILAWMIDGAYLYYDSGLGVPDTVEEAAKEYRSEMDQIGAYIVEKTVPGGKVANADLYADYSQWCDDNGERPWSHRSLTLELKRRGYVQRRQDERYWEGITLKSGNG